MNNTVRILSVLQLMVMGVNALNVPQDIIANFASDETSIIQANYVWAIFTGLIWAILLVAMAIQHLRWGHGWSCTMFVLVGVISFYVSISGVIGAIEPGYQDGALGSFFCFSLIGILTFSGALPLVVWGRGQCPQIMGLALCGLAIYSCIEDLGMLFSHSWYELDSAKVIGDLFQGIGNISGVMATLFRLLLMGTLLLGIDKDYKTKEELI